MSLVVPLRRALGRMKPYHPPLEGRAGRLRLDFNENTAGPSPAVRRALARLTPEQISCYPEYQAAERRLARHFGVRPDQFIATNGTDDALRLIVDAFAEAASEVLVVEPTFAMYRFYAELAGARVLAVRYDRRLRFPLEQVLATLRLRRPRLFFLSNPNNPTGGLVGSADLGRILRAARRTLVVVDEAYFEFAGVTALPWIGRYPNLVVTRTFSKNAGLAGLRLGCLFSNPEMVLALQCVRSPYAVNAAALAAALAAVRDKSALSRYARQVVRARGELERALRRLGIVQFPSAANFVLVNLGARAPEILARLRRRGILLRNRQNDFGEVGWVRITVGTPAQTRLLIRALEKLWPGAR
ncbi:MAG TPA: histidinol-phosphate transaminase [Candidatus Acidoferrales bacterium]|nr:histidinol-phosphate transaminase [Candidatus Acidoferrales bacterium]